MIELVADVVDESGGGKVAMMISAKDSLEYAVMQAGEWFQNWRCLFLVDDVWLVRGINVQVLGQISKPASYSESRIVYATQDVRLSLHRDSVLFKGREKYDVKSSRILLSCAWFSGAPSNLRCKMAYENAQDVCNGLPLMLAVAGSSVDSLKLFVEKEDEAWIHYIHRTAREGIETFWLCDDEGKRRIQEFRKSIDLSINLLKEEFDSVNWSEILETFCIARSQNAVSLHVLQRVWKVSERETERRVEKLLMFSLVQLCRKRGCVESGRGSERKVSVWIHDEILEYLHVLTDVNGKRMMICRGLIDSYLGGCGVDEGFGERPFGKRIRVVDDDGYLTRTYSICYEGQGTDVKWWSCQRMQCGW